jgi:hypothetical protein
MTNPNSLSGFDPRIRPVIESVADVVRERRRVYRTNSAFLMLPGEPEVIQTIANDSAHSYDLDAANALIQELRQKRAKIVSELPALQDEYGRPTGVTAMERLEAFLKYPELAAIDLQRIEHVGEWQAANFLDQEIDDLIDFLVNDPVMAERYWCQRFEISQESCSMHVSDMDQALLPNNLLYVARNSLKAIFTDQDGTIHKIEKRTEFLIDLTKISDHEGRSLLKIISREPVEGFVLEKDEKWFWRFNHFIKRRHQAIIAISSTAGISRTQPKKPAKRHEPISAYEELVLRQPLQNEDPTT